jgi:hypothetical protein
LFAEEEEEEEDGSSSGDDDGVAFKKEESGSEESSDEDDENRKKKGTEGLIAIENPNRWLRPIFNYPPPRGREVHPLGLGALSHRPLHFFL